MKRERIPRSQRAALRGWPIPRPEQFPIQLRARDPRRQRPRVTSAPVTKETNAGQARLHSEHTAAWALHRTEPVRQGSAYEWLAPCVMRPCSVHRAERGPASWFVRPCTARVARAWRRAARARDDHRRERRPWEACSRHHGASNVERIRHPSPCSPEGGSLTCHRPRRHPPGREPRTPTAGPKSCFGLSRPALQSVGDSFRSAAPAVENGAASSTCSLSAKTPPSPYTRC
jgi:hypothetical protein